MRALTVRQPWASAIMWDGKSIENRSTNWAYRGRLAIHAGSRFDRLAVEDVFRRSQRYYLGCLQSMLLGTVDLVDVHPAGVGCGEPCGKWGMPSTEAGPMFHLVLVNPVACTPIPCKGQLGLWTLPDEIAERLAA